MPYNEFESYSNLTGSLTDSSIEQWALSGSDQNLNIDFNDFDNHVVFGSAVSKLENFKSKVSDIEGYFGTISSSLSGSGVSLSGDSIGKKGVRKSFFDKIQTVVNTFTPYEKFLYYDNQRQTTNSSPGLGVNLAHTVPVTGSFITLTNYDGFNLVYKHTGSDELNNEGMNYFKGKYRAEEKPFFNYSGSLYLSFLLKGDHTIHSLSSSWENSNLIYEKGQLPSESFASQSFLSPNITGSQWQRFILAASQSYWRPTVRGDNEPSTISDVDFTDQDTYNILSQSEDILSASGVPFSGSSYPIVLEGDFYPNIGTVVSGSGIPFTGSIMPAGELFGISGSFGVGGGLAANVTASYMTDIKITTKNPLSVLPFSYLYSTGSSEWNDWYGGMYSSASAYDDKNIHSFVSNLPKAIRDDSESNDLKTFVNMLGEQFDLIRNYIDNYQTFYKRRYDKLDSVPTNLLPILADNLGWEVMQLFTGSLAQYFGTSQQDIQVGGRTVEEITHNTWRKVLNNLIYVYKTKGTKTGVRALLNVYGYPNDVLKIQELGGSTRDHNPSVITNAPEGLPHGVMGLSDNVSFIKFKDEMYSWIFNNDPTRLLKFDWETNSATNLETIEFILKPARSINDQIILENSGSGTEKLWDLRLLTSASNHTYGQLEFRLNNTHTGSSAIASNAVSMSTGYLPLKAAGGIWNIMLQKMTSSISGTGTQEYRLYTGLQDGDKIKEFAAVSMSVSGGLTADNPSGSYYANQNWSSTGSLAASASNNLYTGTTYTGSLAEFRAWTTALSASKFKQHILNKKSTVGNNIDASRDEVTYRYALQENWKRGVSTPQIKDSNPKNVSDYTFNISTDLLTGSVLYDRSDIDIYKFSIRMGGVDQPNDNKVLLNPNTSTIANLNPTTRSVRTIYEPNRFNEIKRRLNNKIQIVRSPQTVLNEFIIDNLADFDISEKIADSRDLYESRYSELDKLRDDLFNHFNVTIDINKWIRAQANIFNQSSIDAIQNVLPARTTVENVGVVFEPTLLERDKVKHHEASIFTGSAAGNLDTEHDMMQYYDLDDSSYLDQKTNVIPIGISEDISLADSAYFASKKAEYSIIDLIDKSGDYISSKNVEYDVESNITKEIFYQPPRNTEIKNNIVKEISYQPSRNTEIKSNITKEIFYQPFRNTEYDVESNITKEIFYQPSRNAEYDVESNIIKIMSYDSSKDTEYNINDNIIKTIVYKSPQNAEYDIESNIAKEIFYQPPRNAEIENNITKEIFYQPSRNAEYDVESNIVKEIFYKPTKNTEYDVESNITKEISYQPSRNTEYDVESNIVKKIFYQPSQNTEYDIESNIAKTISYESSKDIEFNIIDSITENMIYELSHDTEYDINSNITKEGNIEDIIDGKNSYITSQSYTSFKNLADSWGTGSSDTHFLAVDSNLKLSNIGYYEQDYVFNTVGDIETIVGQTEISPFNKDGENRLSSYRNMAYDDEKFFANREMRDQGKGYVYKSYIHPKRTFGQPFEGLQDGRPVGKTSYYVSSSSDELIYPSNHWIHFSEDGMRTHFIKGTQNTGGRYMQLNEKVDHSTNAFYSIEVTGENKLKVQRDRV